jgi:hypothetical protein
MEPRTISARPDVAVANTSPRVTPTPPRASRFGEVLSNTAVRSAESAMRMLPGSPMMAVAVRGATGSGGSIGVPMSTMSAGGRGPEGPVVGGAPRIGTTSSALTTTSPSVGTGVGGVAGVGAGSPGVGDGVDSSLQHAQDMNIYYLTIQQEVNAQNQRFTTCSNLMKAEHDTVKTAIGNIR